jgi:hypothetical protein
MLLQQVSKCFVRELLHRRHPIAREPIEGDIYLWIECDPPSHTCFRPPSHQPAFLLRFFMGATSATRFSRFAGFAVPLLSSMLRRSASMRFTTFAGRAAGFSFEAGGQNAADARCFPRQAANSF